MQATILEQATTENRVEVVRTRLSDGSDVFDVYLFAGRRSIMIEAPSESAADHLALGLAASVRSHSVGGACPVEYRY